MFLFSQIAEVSIHGDQTPYELTLRDNNTSNKSRNYVIELRMKLTNFSLD